MGQIRKYVPDDQFTLDIRLTVSELDGVVSFKMVEQNLVEIIIW